MTLTLRSLLIIVLLFVYGNTLAQSTRKKTPASTPTQKTNTAQPVVQDSVKNVNQDTESEDETGKPLRKEFESKKSSNKYYIVPTGKSGVSIFYSSGEKKDGMEEWNWSIYNNQFEEVTTKTFLINPKLGFGDFAYDESIDHIYLFFGKPDNSPSLPAVNGYKDKFEVLDLDINTQSIATI